MLRRVAEVSREPDAQGAPGELDDLLLDAKLAVPTVGHPVVSRAALIDAARATGRRVVDVTAPAGYGKSTLLAQWAASEDRAVAWVSLDRLDDDPLHLLVALASAFARVHGGDARLVGDMVGTQASLLGRAAPRLAAALRTSPVPFVLVLDDLHEVRAPACHDVLGVVIAGIPPGSQLVTAGRTAQPHLPRLRAAGETVEVTAEDLALDVSGTQQVFAASEVPISHATAVAVTERTEGWPVGIFLASLIARDGVGEAAALTGEDPYVSDYLQRETFGTLPEPVRRFLRRTAVLEDLSAPLCDAMLGVTSSRQLLRDLEESHVFLVPLDRHRGWFRYHGLFREFLLGELLATEPELADPLRTRAAAWFEAHDSPARAVELLLATSDREHCVHLVTRIVLTLFQTGRLATIDRWLRALGDDAVAGHPPLAVLAGYAAVYGGRPVDVERWGAVVDAVTSHDDTDDGAPAFAVARAMFHGLRCPDGPERMVQDADLAVAAEPAWSPWRPAAFALSGEARLLVGEHQRAAQDLEQAAEAAAALDDSDTLVLALAHLAHLDMDHGRWRQADGRVQRALAVAEEHRIVDYPTCALAFAAGARVHLHRGDTDEATRLLTRGMRARTSCTYAYPTLAVRVRLHLARTSWATGDVATVRHLQREVDDVLRHRPALGALADEAAVLRTLLDPVRQAPAPGVAGGPLTPAELRLLPYLQTHLTIREIGERLFVSRNTASSEIGSIYRKLGVSSRSEAVRRAAAVGLLGP